jgi:hypothetical protein
VAAKPAMGSMRLAGAIGGHWSPGEAYRSWSVGGIAGGSAGGARRAEC